MILLMTAYADQRERASNLDALIHDVILKPFTLAEIKAAVSGCAGAQSAALRGSKILQQPLDIVELELRPQRVGKALAQLFEDAARALHIDLARHLHRHVVAVVAPAQRPAERIGVVVGARLPGAARLTRALPWPALLHLLRQVLRAAPQRFQRAALGIDRAVGIALAELALGIAHGAVGLAEPLARVLTLLALLTLLACCC